jgi:hypothetical protein
MRSYLGMLALLLGGLLPVPALADAGTGELAGYRLGDTYPVDASTVSKPARDGTLRITAQSAQPPADADAVFLYATAESRTIGKILVTRWFKDLAAAEAAAARQKMLLEAAYPDWERLQAPLPMPRGAGAMVSRLQRTPYGLVVFYQQDGDRVEVVVELEYAPTSAERKAWRQLTAAERPAG